MLVLVVVHVLVVHIMIKVGARSEAALATPTHYLIGANVGEIDWRRPSRYHEILVDANYYN